jgi:hypothetical protein
LGESRPHSGMRSPACIAVAIAVALFYVWTATSSHGFAWGEKQADYLNQLADGFLAGHLYLPQEPPKELLALPDPFDPVASRRFRLHDASLYHAHYYLYFGPVPVLTLFLPWRAITGSGLPNNFAVLLYVTAGYVFSCLLFFRLARVCDVELRWWGKCAALMALGLCQTAPLLLRRAYIYETVIAAGFCFFVGGIYFLARRVLDASPAAWHTVAAGMLLGLTPGCRPNYALVVVLVAALYGWYLWRWTGLRGSPLQRELLRFAFPIAVCGLLLAWYNSARFGNPLEFGQSYQLTSSALDRGIGGNYRNVLPNLYKLLFERPLVIRHFPFLELVNNGPFGSETWPDGIGSMETVCGLLTISPICVAAALLPWLLRHHKVAGGLRFVLMALGASAAASVVCIAMVVHQASQRYELDFAPAALIVAMLVVSSWVMNARRTWVAAGISAATFLFSALAQAGLSINSYADGLMSHNPAAFNRLASFFGDDERSMRRYVFGLTWQGEVVLPQRPAASREALLTTGVRGRNNAFFVEYPAAGRVRFGYFATSTGMQYSPELTIEPGKRYPLVIQYSDAVHAFRILLAGQDVFEQFAAMYPTSVAATTVGRNDLGAPENVAPFSGELQGRLQFSGGG